MRMAALILLATIALLVSCNDARKPSDDNFTAAINQYFAKHGQVCTLIGRAFPIDVPKATPSDAFGIGAQMTALQQADLVSETDTTAAVHGMLGPLRGPTPPQPVRHYQLTVDGQKSFAQVPGAVGSTGGFCYGRKTVDRIVNWTQPQAGSSQAEVTYTYRIESLASWAGRSDVEQAFPDIRTTLDGASKANQVVGVQLTDTGWAVPGPQ